VVTAALIFAGLAAVLHVYIFVLESLQWTEPRTRATFGTTLESAEATKELAFNQGFYNLFLGIYSKTV
jgi:putative membrane protein